MICDMCSKLIAVVTIFYRNSQGHYVCVIVDATIAVISDKQQMKVSLAPISSLYGVIYEAC